MDFYKKNIKDVYKELAADENGLSNEQAQERLAIYGRNELPSGKKIGILQLFFLQFQNPMELILIITVILSFFVGEIVDASAVLLIILIDVIIGTYEEWRALCDAQTLMNLIKVKVQVIRSSKKIEVDASDITVGDILVLESGMKVSADARIITCYNFQVDESSLTGEGIGVIKNSDVLLKDAPITERINMVYAGTSVLTGRALAIVTQVGSHTEIGKIAHEVINTKEEKSPLMIRIQRFSKQISCILLVIAILVAFLLKAKNFPMSDILLSIIALAVSAMPEGLSLALTMALTVASKRMAKKNVIVKKLNAVEALGSCTVIASDKTGTLTVNEQTAQEIVLKDGSRFTITGTGYNDKGEILCKEGANIEHAKKLALLGYINNEASLQYENGKWIPMGDSIDIAFLSLALKLKLNNIPKILNRIPYESENQYSAVFYEQDGDIYCTVKGSLERVMEFSEYNELYVEQNRNLTKLGYRVIALANGKVEGSNFKDIQNLEFVGMVAFIDPVREGVRDSIVECKKAGIKVVMITGDHPLTAYAIARDLHLCEDESEVATGEEIIKYKKLGEQEFDAFVRHTKVFSRVTPMDKLDIVASYKRQGEFIAVTGDGVNDAPAIKTANIGVSMGSGTSVAKETSSMIIGNDDFTSIVTGIKEGRCAYSNIRKITLFLLSCGFAEVCFFLLSILFDYEIPLLAIQLLWLNMVTDGLQDISLSFEKAENNIMGIPPRPTKESLFSKDLIMEVVILGMAIVFIVFGVWKYMMDHNFDITFARSVVMMLMVFIQNINVLNCRSEKHSIFQSSLFSNKFVFVTVIGSILLQIILTEIPFTASFLKVTPLPWMTIIKLFGLSFVIIAIYEIYKFVYKLFFRKKRDF